MRTDVNGDYQIPVYVQDFEVYDPTRRYTKRCYNDTLSDVNRLETDSYCSPRERVLKKIANRVDQKYRVS